MDGELYSDTLNFNQIYSALNSEDKPLDAISLLQAIKLCEDTFVHITHRMLSREHEASECDSRQQDKGEAKNKKDVGNDENNRWNNEQEKND